MRKKTVLLLPLCVLAAAAVWAAAAGDAADPLVSLSYLNGAFTNTVDAEIPPLRKSPQQQPPAGQSPASKKVTCFWSIPAAACCCWREAVR